MKSFHDYLGLSNSCSYDVIGQADRFGFQNFCSPALDIYHCTEEKTDNVLTHYGIAVSI